MSQKVKRNLYEIGATYSLQFDKINHENWVCSFSLSCVFLLSPHPSKKEEEVGSDVVSRDGTMGRKNNHSNILCLKT